MGIKDMVEIRNLKTYLVHIGVNLKDFAEIIEVAPSYLSRIIHGTAFPSNRLAREIKRATSEAIDLPSRPRKNKKQEQQQKTKP